MSLIELILALPGLCAAPLAVGLWIRQRRTRPATEPVPVLQVALGVAWVAVGVVVGPTLGWALQDVVLQGAVPEGAEVVAVSPTDAAWVLLAVARLAAIAWALPGVALTAWLLGSRARAVPAAAGFAAVVTLGGLAGAIVGFLVPMRLDMGFDGALFGVATLVGLRSNLMLWGLVAGSCLGTGYVAASSREGLVGVLVATLFAPLWALTLGAPLTPPDVPSQVLFAGPVLLCWGLGVIGGGAVGWALGRLTPA
ncbi:MAG: hypothetical protein R3F59_34735 [Myxococcota bacterium]